MKKLIVNLVILAVCTGFIAAVPNCCSKARVAEAAISTQAKRITSLQKEEVTGEIHPCNIITFYFN